MHLKRNKIPKTWPLTRKGTKYVIRSVRIKDAIPALIVLRNILKLVKNRKEAQRLINENKIKVNNKLMNDVAYSLTLFDVLSLDNKHYKIILKNKKFSTEEISGNNAEEKISKVIGKRLLKGNKIQISLNDGRSYQVKEKISVGDSIIIDLKENKIKKVLEFKKGSKVIVTKGKHSGKSGVIEEIDKEKNIVKIKGDEELNSRKESLMIIG